MLSRTLALAVLPLALAALPACKAQQRAQGDRGLVASYSGFSLSADLPAEARVPAVVAAAEQTLRARGYTIDSNESTEESGRLIARPPRTNDPYPRLVVGVTASGDASHITLTYQPLGDQELCRSVLDGILSRLGL